MKKIFIIFILLLLAIPAIGKNSQNKYEILLNLCKSMRDKPCQLKYYSYLYDSSSFTKKKEILQEADNIINSLNKFEYNKIDFSKFKKNFIYLIAKLSILKFKQDANLINEVLNEADNLEIYDEIYKYIKTNYKIELTQFESITKKINILLLLPLNGNLKKFGEKCLEGFLTAVKFFNNNFSRNRLITFYTIDTNNKNFVKDLRESLRQKNIQIIIGPLRNSVEKESVLEAKRSNVPIISLVINSKVRHNYRFYFNHSLNINDEIKQIAEIIKNNNYHVGILYPHSPFGNRFKYNLLKNHVIPEISIGYPPDNVDFKEQIIALGNLRRKSLKTYDYIQNNNINSVFIADDIEKALLIIPQLYFYDLKHLTIIGTNLWNSPRLFKLDKKFQNNIIFFDLIDYHSENESFLKFKSYLKKYFNDTPDYYNTIAYDTAKIILKENFSTNENFRYFLTNTKFFLLTGLTNFDNNGISHKKFKTFKLIHGSLMSY